MSDDLLGTETGWRSIWAWRLRHPSCLPRVLRGTVRSAYLWRVQGCPADVPVVIRPGRLIADRDGRGIIRGFYFDFSRMTAPVHVEDLWDRLSATYPVERIH